MTRCINYICNSATDNKLNLFIKNEFAKDSLHFAVEPTKMARYMSGTCTLVLLLLYLAQSTVAQSFGKDCYKENSINRYIDYEVRCPYINNA